jgi:hypothetical protein
VDPGPPSGTDEGGIWGERMTCPLDHGQTPRRQRLVVEQSFRDPRARLRRAHLATYKGPTTSGSPYVFGFRSSTEWSSLDNICLYIVCNGFREAIGIVAYEESVNGLDSLIRNGVPNGIGFQARDWSQSQVRRFGEFKPVLNPV